MSPQEIQDAIRHRPFEPFRLVLSHGGAFDVRSPELCMVGQRTVIVGLTASAGEELFERTVKLDLLHITRIEPLATPAPPGGTGNGANPGPTAGG